MRQRLREERSKLQGASKILRDLNPVAHEAAHAVDPAVAQIPGGGTANQVLAKDSDADFDVSWVTAVTTTLSGGSATTVFTVGFITGGGASG